MEAAEPVTVVGVVVVHEPGAWFAETLQALAAQNYPDLRWLILLASDPDGAARALIDEILPGALVREVDPSSGFAGAANGVLDLVAGDNGLFLLCHDDIAPDPGAVSMLVAEFHRSNAGLVGPKLVDWHDRDRLQSVGSGLDRFGEPYSPIEPGELDQSQHDAVRDVFVLPTACLLVRADLLRSLGGFDRRARLHGEDLDLCWRAHWAGARVIVAPEAVVRHRADIAGRRPEIDHGRERARRRMWSGLTLTGAARLVPRALALIAVTLVEFVVGAFTGRLAEGWRSLTALGHTLIRLPAVIARRHEIRLQRAVPEYEVIALQTRGSARLASYLRSRQTAIYVSQDATVRRWRQRSSGLGLTWSAVIALVLIGSRDAVVDAFRPVGALLALPTPAFEWFASMWSAWDPRGIGATSPAPTGWGILGALDAALLFQEGLTRTVLVLGLVLLGILGASRLASVFPLARARIAAIVVYAAAPIVARGLAAGELDTLVLYAALPWSIEITRRIAGIATADPGAVLGDLPDGLDDPSPGLRRRLIAGLILVLATSAALAPSSLIVIGGVGVAMALGGVLVRADARVNAWFVVASIIGLAGAWVANLPWSSTWTRVDLIGGAGSGERLGVWRALAGGGTGRWYDLLALGLWVPLLAAVLVSRAWRMTWAARAAATVTAAAVLIVLDDRGLIGPAIPSHTHLAVAIALGLALGAAAITGGFNLDVLGRDFGWRQPLALLANLGLVVGLLPALVAVGAGDWRAPQTPTASLIASQFPARSDVGSYRVLWLGDDRLLPVPGHPSSTGVSWAVVDGGPLDMRQAWSTPLGPAEDRVESALGHLADGTTARAGRLLAPLGIRYIAVPVADGVASRIDDPLPLPVGLVASLAAQLDIGAIQSPPTVEVFVNRSWIPPAAYLTGGTAEASTLAGEGSLVVADLSGTSTLVDPRGEAVDVVDVAARRGATSAVVPEAGVLHLGVPFDGSWRAALDGVELSARAGFGVTTAFDVPGPGVLEISYDRPVTRTLWLGVLAAIWLTLIAATLRTRGGTRAVHEPVLDLGPLPSVEEGPR